MEPEIIFTGSIIPVDVKVLTKNGTQYLDYTGTVNTNLGKLKIRFPEIGLEFNQITTSHEDDFISDTWQNNRRVKISYNVVINDDKWYTYEILEREMTNEDISKILGYKVKIITENKYRKDGLL